MWKEETPVSRLIDDVGRQKVTIILMIFKGAFMSSFIFSDNNGR